MRTLFVVLILAVSLAPAQIKMATNRSYAATDTTSWYGINAQLPTSLAFSAADSCNVKILIDYRGASAPATVYRTMYPLGTDSTNSADNNGYYRGFVIRSGVLDSIAGASMVRARIQKLTTKNGTTSATYKLLLYQ